MASDSTSKLLLIPATLAVLVILGKCEAVVISGDFMVKEGIRNEIFRMLREHNESLVISAEDTESSDIRNETIDFVNRVLKDDFDIEVVFKDMSSAEFAQESAPPEIVVCLCVCEKM
jgi:hypothetical protein